MDVPRGAGRADQRQNVVMLTPITVAAGAVDAYKIYGKDDRRFIGNFYSEQSYDKSRDIPDSEITGTDPPLMYAEVQAAFDRSKPTPEQ